MKMAAPWVRVVIVNFNGGDHLARAVEGLAGQTHGDFEAVVVDNASTDGSIGRLCLPDRRFRVLPAGGNLGFAAGCNLGSRGAATPWLAMLNPDAVPEPGWLEALKSATRLHAGAAMFGSTQLSAENEAVLDGAGDNYSIFGLAWRGGHGASAALVTDDIRVFSPCAAAALYRRDAFEAEGGFAESFFCYLDDVDLGFRLRLAGHEAVQVAAARVTHVGSAIAGRQSPFTLYHSARNGVFLLLRCMPLPLLALALPLHLAAQMFLIARLRRRALISARIRGLFDGWVPLRRLLAERRAIGLRRRLALAGVADLLVWNPLRVTRRRIVPLGGDPG